MPDWFYEGDRESKIAKALEALEIRSRQKKPDSYKEDLRAFVEHQLPRIYDGNEKNPMKRYRMRPNWVAEQPPDHLKYVLDGFWFEWQKARVRWGEIVYALRDRYCQAEQV
jgi:hypothetical protein